MGLDGAGLSCPGSSVVADENDPALVEGSDLWMRPQGK